MELVDFSNCLRRRKTYGGANGNKISVIYDDHLYMLKFPSEADKNKELKYSHNVVCEYIGCHIFELVGIPVQKTILGHYQVNNQSKLVVACQDFTQDGRVLQDFGSLKNQMIDSSRSGYGTDLNEVLYTIEHQQSMDAVLVEQRFWEMFIIDALLGNWDRHNGNWGFLYNQADDSVDLAPVYDCGSALFSQVNEENMQKIMESKFETNRRVYDIPTSSLMENGRRINYYRFFQRGEYTRCNDVLLHLFSRIDMGKIQAMIYDIPVISEIQKSFYVHMLSARYALILKQTYKRLTNESGNTR